MGRKLGNVLIALVLVGGIALACYPLVSNWLNQRFAFSVIGKYRDAVDQMSDEDIEEKKKAAQEYNATLPNGGDYVAYGDDSESSIDLLNVGEILGELEIPRIHVDLPIYEGTSEEVLQKGVGHLKNTSLPVGGKGTHVGLSAHRGLPSAELFSDLDKLEIGDVFYLNVLDETLAYQVDRIKVTDPMITDELDIDDEEDYVTLITCTPYGINSHRLLVRGKRIAYQESVPETINKTVDLEGGSSSTLMICIISCMAELLLVEALIMLIVIRKKYKS